MADNSSSELSDDAADRLVSTLREISEKDIAPAHIGIVSAQTAVLVRTYEAIAALELILLLGDHAETRAQAQIEARAAISKAKTELGNVLSLLVKFGEEQYGGKE